MFQSVLVPCLQWQIDARWTEVGIPHDFLFPSITWAHKALHLTQNPLQLNLPQSVFWLVNHTSGEWQQSISWIRGHLIPNSLFDTRSTLIPKATLIARFMGPTWGPSGADRTQVGPMLAPWTLLSGYRWPKASTCCINQCWPSNWRIIRHCGTTF